jgi:hypothetical protein
MTAAQSLWHRFSQKLTEHPFLVNFSVIGCIFLPVVLYLERKILFKLKPADLVNLICYFFIFPQFFTLNSFMFFLMFPYIAQMFEIRNNKAQDEEKLRNVLIIMTAYSFLFFINNRVIPRHLQAICGTLFLNLLHLVPYLVFDAGRTDPPPNKYDF